MTFVGDPTNNYGISRIKIDGGQRWKIKATGKEIDHTRRGYEKNINGVGGGRSRLQVKKLTTQGREHENKDRQRAKVEDRGYRRIN